MKILTPKEVSSILCLGKNQTYELMNSKVFPSYRIGNKIFVTDEELEKWVRSIKGKQIFL
jgi:excisionase family DNA binding protein